MKQEQVNDLEILDKIVANELSIAKKLLALISSPSYEPSRGDIPVTLDFLKKLPKIVAIKFSPITYILKEDPSDALAAFALSLINSPRKWVAPFPSMYNSPNYYLTTVGYKVLIN